MTKDTYITEVIFRKFKDGGDVIALFPYEIESITGLINSYMRIGQHGCADIGLVRDTKLAEPFEYADLFRELESIGYNLKVIKKINRKKYSKALRKLQLKYK